MYVACFMEDAFSCSFFFSFQESSNIFHKNKGFQFHILKYSYLLVLTFLKFISLLLFLICSMENQSNIKLCDHNCKRIFKNFSFLFLFHLCECMCVISFFFTKRARYGTKIIIKQIIKKLKLKINILYYSTSHQE